MEPYMYLESEILSWARTRGIFTSGTREGQAKKMLEEAGEVLAEVAVGETTGDPSTVARVQKEIGDVLVTAIILAEMYGVNTDECLDKAFRSIKDRTGVMKNGQFVKAETPKRDAKAKKQAPEVARTDESDIPY